MAISLRLSAFSSDSGLHSVQLDPVELVVRRHVGEDDLIAQAAGPRGFQSCSRSCGRAPPWSGGLHRRPSSLKSVIVLSSWPNAGRPTKITSSSFCSRTVPSTLRSGRAPAGSAPSSVTSTPTVPLDDAGIDPRDLAGDDAVARIDFGDLADVDVLGLGFGDAQLGLEDRRIGDTRDVLRRPAPARRPRPGAPAARRSCRPSPSGRRAGAGAARRWTCAG